MTDATRFVLSESEMAAAAHNFAAEPGLKSALAVLAEPAMSIAAVRLHPGDAAPATMALAGDGHDRFAAHGGTSEARDIVWLETREDAVLQLGEFLHLTRPDFACEPRSLSLTRDAWGAALTIADALREFRLRAALASEAAPGTWPLDLFALERLLESGLASGDSRWAVACARVMALPESAIDDVDLFAGVSFLGGLLLVDAESAELTVEGLALANDLATAVSWGQVVIRFADGVTNPRASTLIRSPLATWALSPDPETGLLHLDRLDTGGAIVRLLRLLAPPPPPPAVIEQAHDVEPAPAPAGYCGQCGRPRRAGAKFCGGCGNAFRT